MWFFLVGDGQSPSNCPLSWRVLGVVLRRKRSEGFGNDFASASAASIDARMVRCFSGRILLVELRTDADFYVIAAPKDRHGFPSFVRKPQPSMAEVYGQPTAWSLRKDEGHVEICSRAFRGNDISAAQGDQAAAHAPAGEVSGDSGARLRPSWP